MAPRKKKTEDHKILRYPDSAMQSAIAAVREGRFKIREASRHFGVPHSTLINKLKGRVPEIRKMGRDTYLSKSEELLLKNYIIAKAKRGIHITRTALLDTVQKIISDDKRSTPFKNCRPGRKWVELFYKRNPELTEKKAEGISTAKANVTAQDIKDWHNSLREYLAAENNLDILEEPQRIFNADESGFQTCPESGKVLGPVGMKNFYEIKSGKQKEQLTVMVTINAAGQTVPPMIIYPLMRISKDISNNVPEEWAIGKSKSGWMTGPLYFEFIVNVFDPWIKENNIKKPVLLLIDGHRSHMTLQVSQYCEQNGIIAYALFPNSTHICQPADVSVFKCLKSGWSKIVHEYKQTSGNRQITRAGFAPLLAKVFKEKVTTTVVKNGFARCGIYPFNISAIDFMKCMDHEIRKVAPVIQSTLDTEVGVEIILLLESFMRSGRVEQFRRTGDDQWHGDESAKELFYVWRKLQRRCILQPPIDEPPTEDRATFFDNGHKPTEAHTPEPDTPPLELDYDFSNVESQTPSRFLSPIPTPTMHLESTSSSVSHFLEPPSHKLVDLIAKKQQEISPAFGKHLIWPSDSPLKNKKTERLPFATTSKKWQDYWVSKEKEKEEKTEKAENRKRIREEKRLKKEEERKRKNIKAENKRKHLLFLTDEEEITELGQTSDSETDSCNEKEYDINCSNTQSKPENFVKGDFVIVKFLYSAHSSKTLEKKYIGQVIDALEGSHVLVKFMRKSPKVENTFVFPQVDDEQLIRPENVVLKIRPLTVARGRYVFPKFIKDYACC